LENTKQLFWFQAICKSLAAAAIEGMIASRSPPQVMMTRRGEAQSTRGQLAAFLLSGLKPPANATFYAITAQSVAKPSVVKIARNIKNASCVFMSSASSKLPSRYR
jgi:hypothetical protein